MEPMVNGTAEEFISAWGEAVVRVWSRLPQDVQHHLFEQAVTSRGEDHPRTWDPLGKPRHTTEPDSLGG